MEQFIALAAEKLGVDKGTVQSALGIVLNLIEENGSGEFQALIARLPGAEGVLNAVPVGGSGGGGLLGQAAGAFGGVLGGESSLGALAQLQQTDLDPGQLGTLLEMFKGYAEKEAGEDVTQRAFASVPGLGALMG